MSATPGAPPRRPLSLPRGPLLALTLLLPMTATLALRAGSVAEPGREPVQLDPEQARRAGLALELHLHPEFPAAVLEVRGVSPPGVAGRPASILAASPDGARVALADRRGQDPTTLVIASADGGQLRVPFDGLIAAGFAPDGGWLAAIDGVGRLWQVDATDGRGEVVADGPFTGSVAVEATGGILALAVPSVEAPFSSTLVRVDAAAGTVTPLSDEALVYDVQPLSDGALAVVVHRPGGTLLLHLRAVAAEVAVELGPGAVNVSVSDDLQVVAWELAGEVLVRSGRGEPVRIGAGSDPRVASNGELILVQAPDGARAYAADGELLAELAGHAVLLACGGCAS